MGHHQAGFWGFTARWGNGVLGEEQYLTALTTYLGLLCKLGLTLEAVVNDVSMPTDKSVRRFAPQAKSLKHKPNVSYPSSSSQDTELMN